MSSMRFVFAKRKTVVYILLVIAIVYLLKQGDILVNGALADNNSSFTKSLVSDSSEKEQDNIIEIAGTEAMNLQNTQVSNNCTGVAGGRQALIWAEGQPAFEWKFDIAQDGDYEIEVVYYPLQGDNMPIQRSFEMDGEKSQDGNEGFILYRNWEEVGGDAILKNNLGDDVRPRMKEVSKWMSCSLNDGLGKDPDPYRFYLKAGSHILCIKNTQGSVAIEKILIKPYMEIPKYKKVEEEYKNNHYPYASIDVVFQAEAATQRNDPSIRRENDRDLSTEPYSPANRRLNVLGAERWKKGGQAVTWEFDIMETGLYKIGMRVGQWWNDGLPSYRCISIDGQVPFEELKAYRFEFDDDWRIETLRNPKESDYYFYLKKGLHSLTMSVVLGETEQIIKGIEKSVNDISSLYRDIVMLTSNSPDVNFDYEFERNIPNLIPRMKNIKNNIDQTMMDLNAITSKRTAIANHLSRVDELFSGLIQDPFIIARKLDDINNMMTSMGTWLADMENGPLVLDYFLLGGQKTHWENPKPSFAKKIVALLQEFWLSFFKDYDNVGKTVSDNKVSNKTLDVWMARGNEWAELLKELADESFTPETGIGLRINVLTSDQLKTGGINSLMLSVAAGNAPDVCLGMDMDAPVEFAIRDAVIDLSQFMDFNDFSSEFNPALFEPLRYKDGVYGFPETMNFLALFFRKDIIEKFNIKIPDTWEEVYEDVLPVLYRNNMLFNYPSSTVLNQTNFNSFGNFLFQNGGELYKDEGKKSALDSAEAFKAFKEWTQLYTNYDFPIAANFFNRFRTGEMPIGIGGYDAYILLTTAAPELRGKWDMAAVPGQIDAQGKISRVVTGTAGTYVVILSQSKSTEDAWKFIKWWMDTGTQKEYSREIESLMGVQARWNSANLEAFKSLPWGQKHLDILLDEFKNAKEKPVVLGGYFTLRHITNAWTRVVINGMDPRDSIENAVKDINSELLVRQEEYGVK